MGLKWIDVQDIAIELCDTYPDVDPLTVSFPDMYNRIVGLDDFDDDPKHSGEKILEAIQMAWIDEAS
jgi:FeS assembly protein IscX